MDQGLPGHQGGRHEGVVGRIGPRGGDLASQLVGSDLERVGVGQRRPQGLRERLGVACRLRGQSRFTAAAAARIRIIPPYPM